MVGPKGRVYASDINPRHCEYMSNLVQKLGLKNIEVIYSEPQNMKPRPAPGSQDLHGIPGARPTNGLAMGPDRSLQGMASLTNNAIGLSNKVDMAFLCSLYHVLYTHTDENLAGLLESIKAVLKPDGTLAIIDNSPVEDKDLPYFGPFIAKELVVAQLKHYGFRLAGTHQFIPQRYLLLFKQVPQAPPAAPQKGAVSNAMNIDETCVEVKSRKSLVRLGAFMPGEKGRTAAQNLLEGLEKHQAEKIRAAKMTFAELIPQENFGGEYTALEWFCNYYLTAEAQRAALLTNALTSDYLHFFADTNWANLQEFLKRRYNLVEMPDKDTSEGEDRNSYLQDVIFFNNPRREEWEKTSLLINALQIKPGDYIADVGCGTGYYTFPFAEKAGPTGRVFAIETNEKHVEYITDFVKRNRVSNVRPIRSKINDICLNEKVDMVYLCSLYPMIYLTSMEKPKDMFFESIKQAMKPGGRLVIVDNDIVELPTIPYHASCIDRRLVIAQLKYYGFRLVATHQFIPQRYMLVFQKTTL
jgi:SAM-dependent methyltransferase